MTANSEYSRSNRENLPLPVQMQLSEKPKTFCQFFIAFLESTLHFKHFEKKGPHSLLKCIKNLVSENSLAVKVLKLDSLLPKNDFVCLNESPLKIMKSDFISS